MAISITRYVNIVSSVGAGTAVNRRSLIGRMFTQSQYVPTDSFITFTNAEDVGDWFGFTSDEYYRASFYFGWTSKNGVIPPAVDFARYNPANTFPQIFGNIQPQDVADYDTITTGSFTLTLGAHTESFNALDFTAVVSLADVANVLQTAIQAIVAGGLQWTAATVTYDAVRGSFNLVGGDNTAAAPVSVAEGIGGQPVGNLIGWVQGPTLIWSDGAVAQSPVEAVSESAAASDNFGSFLFLDVLGDDDIVDVATWNYGQNVKFMYCVPAVDQTQATTYNGLLSGIGGVQITLAPLDTQYPEQAPMMILAATNYDQTNSVQNYMFQIFNLDASVSDDASANIYDALKVNYYGVTQTAGQYLAFYQRGYMQGPASSPGTQNVYANEIWLKDAMAASLMNLLITQAKVSANDAGQSQILAVLQSVIDEATDNGTISANKKLTTTQIGYITATTGDPNAWYQVQTIGYWLDCEIVPYNPVPNVTEYKAVYTLIYSKDDVINLITGQQVLI